MLHLQRVSATVENSPRWLESSFAISRTGVIVLGDDRGDDSLYSVIDTTGHVVHRVGRAGDGPDEVRDGAVVGVGDSSVLLAEASRLSEFALDGRPMARSALRDQVVLRVAVSDSEALGLLSLRGGFFPAIASVRDGRVRAVVAASDSFIDASFPPGYVDGHVVIGVIGVRPDGFVVGDGWHYHLAFYDWNGTLRRVVSRTLPPVRWSGRRIANEVRRTILSLQSVRGRLSPADSAQVHGDIANAARPYFAHTGHLGLDGENRTWVVGVDGDSGYADLFSDRGFLGRLALPCPDFDGGWSVNGSWLALACAPDGPDFPGDAVFRVYRLIEPATAADR